MKKVQVDKCSLWWSFKMLTTLILATTTSSENTVCPFNHIYHFGDGFTDIGNSIHVDPNAVVPSAFPPYGITYPGSPTGRWSDGLTDFDYSGIFFFFDSTLVSRSIYISTKKKKEVRFSNKYIVHWN